MQLSARARTSCSNHLFVHTGLSLSLIYHQVRDIVKLTVPETGSCWGTGLTRSHEPLLGVAGNASRLMVSGDGYFGCRHGCQAGGQKAAETTAWPTDLDAGVHFSGRHAASSGTARPGLATSMIEHVGRCAGARYSRQLRIFRHEFLRLPPSPSFFAAFCNPCQSSARRHLHGAPRSLPFRSKRAVQCYMARAIIRVCSYRGSR